MVRFLTLTEMFEKLRQRKKLNIIIDKLTFTHILLIWTGIIILFGFLYFFFTNGHSHLAYSPNQQHVRNLLDSIYFSFITATSTGFGDIIPSGFFKIIAIFEVIFGLLLLSFVTSKLVSIKQDIILSEIYEISFNEKVNRIRSSLLVFRQNIGRLIDKVEDNTIHRREVNDIYVYISSFEDVLNEILAVFGKAKTSNFTKNIDPVNMELIFSSIVHSVEKLDELLRTLTGNKKEWKREVTITLINRCISIDAALFEKLNSSRNVNEKSIADLNARNKAVIASIKSLLALAQTNEAQQTPAVEPYK